MSAQSRWSIVPPHVVNVAFTPSSLVNATFTKKEVAAKRARLGVGG